MHGRVRRGISLAQASKGEDNNDGYQQRDSERSKPSPVFWVPGNHGSN
jgi:hypothetical protein